MSTICAELLTLNNALCAGYAEDGVVERQREHTTPLARKKALLEKAAEKACGEYRADTDLTAFSALDGEAFYETR